MDIHQVDLKNIIVIECFQILPEKFYQKTKRKNTVFSCHQIIEIYLFILAKNCENSFFVLFLGMACKAGRLVMATVSLSLTLSILFPSLVTSTYLEDFDHTLPMRDMYFVDQVEVPDHAAALRKILGVNRKAKEMDVEEFSRKQKEYEERVTDVFVREIISIHQHEQDNCPLATTGPNIEDFYASPTELTTYSGINFSCF